MSKKKQDKRAEVEPKREDKKPVQASFFEVHNGLVEQIYDLSLCKMMFIHWDDKLGYNPRTGPDPGIEIGNEVHIPVEGDEYQYGAIKLPTGVEEYGDVGKLIEKIKEHIHRYVDVSSFFETIATYYVLISWLYDEVYVLPYLRLRGDVGTGKTRALDVIGGLLYKAISTSGCITPAPIYRLQRKWNGSLIIDEGDFKDSSEQAEVIKILNTGIEVGKPIIRCNTNDPAKLDIFPVYGPKMLSTRRDFKDKALESRCITEIMKQTTRSDISDQLPKKFHEEQEALRNKLLLFRFRHHGKVDSEEIQEVEMGDIEPRLRQVTRSLLVFMMDKPEIRKRFLDFLKDYNQTIIEERADSFEGWVVNSIFKLKEDGHEHITSQMIANRIAEEYAPKREPTAQRVGVYLKTLGIQVKLKRTENGVLRAIVWNNDLMEILKSRYVTSVSSVTEDIAEGESVTEPQSHSDVTNVTDVTDTDSRERKIVRREDGAIEEEIIINGAER